MKVPHSQILLIIPPDENIASLREILVSKGYDTIIASSVTTALQKISETAPDLVICHHKSNESGLMVFNRLQPVLPDTPFMLYLKEFVKEDILIGLELGIDSFIIYPYEKQALLRKVDKLLKNGQKAKIFDSEKFTRFFETTPVAKFVSEFDRLIKVNDAFSRVTGVKNDGKNLPKLSEVFDFSKNEDNELELRRCMTGLKEYCLFKSVSLKCDKEIKFDIHLVFNDYFGKNLYTGEITLVQSPLHVNGSSKPEHEKHSILLTQREKQVLDLSGKGLSIKQIAIELGLSARTVEKHRANIMEKTKTSNIIEAIYYLHE